MDEEVTLSTGSTSFDIRVKAPGEIEIYVPDGQLEIRTASLNVARVRCVPIWDDTTAVKILAHIIGAGETMRLSVAEAKAEQIVALLRGRQRPGT